MTKRDPEPAELLARFNAGEKIPREETRSLTERLTVAVSPEETDDWDFDEIYELVLAIGKMSVVDAEPLLERLLDAQESLTVCLVLETLCSRWKKHAEYVERIMSFAIGVSWDDDLDVQEKAIELLGSYAAAIGWAEEAGHQKLKSKPAATAAVKSVNAGGRAVDRVLELLWQQFASADEPLVVRKAAYRAIQIAAGQVADNTRTDRQLSELFRNLPRVHDISALGAEFDHEALRKVYQSVRH